MKTTIKPLYALKNLVERLRGKDGCPWDQKQTPIDAKNYLIDEIYELLEAIDENNTDHICEELGDVLLLVMLVTRMYEEKGCFDIDQVATFCREKMIRRHPHVFGDARAKDAEAVLDRWHQIKNKEKQDSHHNKKFLDSVPANLPALHRAYQLTERAARVGFDWYNRNAVEQKVDEEYNEFKTALLSENSKDIQSEMGDLIFSLVNISRWCKIHPETALNDSIQKFIHRFSFIEKQLIDQGKSLESASLEEMDALWNAAKKEESP
ncbi:MAG: nucleoside triphosphate pyrophosphohydrolase [Candidatus Magnetomorum sp.]|nr:nucleoside triphosphate pyrophosphohydrolase [Candidatus Magnetomorum sp.]